MTGVDPLVLIRLLSKYGMFELNRAFSLALLSGIVFTFAALVERHVAVSYDQEIYLTPQITHNFPTEARGEFRASNGF